MVKESALLAAAAADVINVAEAVIITRGKAANKFVNLAVIVWQAEDVAIAAAEATDKNKKVLL